MSLQVLAGDDASSSSGDSDFGDKVTASLQLVVKVALLRSSSTCAQAKHREFVVRFHVLVANSQSCCLSV